MTYQSTENDVLDLSGQSLKTVPKSILKNPNLRVLNLKDNQLTELPSFITELKYLEVLELRNNDFKIAPELILQFKNLKTLSLSENRLTVIPKSFRTLSRLTDFDIGANPLVEFPDWLDKLYALKDLGIYDLKLTNLPEVVTRIKYLEILSLDENDLKTLPDSIDNLRYLKELWAEGNCFEYLPETFGNLSRLEKINLGVNQLKDLPESICNLRKLEHLSVSENNIQELPHNIGQLRSLTYLNISYNEITTLPSSFSRFNHRTTDVWFDGNPYNEVTKRQIKISFPDIEDYELENDIAEPEHETTLISDKGTIRSIETREAKVNKGYGPSTSIAVISMAAVLFIVFLVVSMHKEDPLIAAHKKAAIEYNAVLMLYKKNRDSIQKNNRQLYVYTNDTTQLKTTLEPNIDLYTNPYAPSYSNVQSKTAALTEFLNDKSLGYDIILDNKRVQLKQAKVFDSVFSKESIKKYSLVVDYKMSQKEIEIKKKHRSKYYNILHKNKDTVYNSEKIVLTSKELADRKISSGYRRILAPIIDLDNKDYHFYFSPHDNNYTKQEFEKAVEDFKALFLKEHTNRNKGTIKELKLEIEQ